nr:putative reverse transcriptase domain-containing protein [Tanacetum cinerariifolium]
MATSGGTVFLRPMEEEWGFFEKLSKGSKTQASVDVIDKEVQKHAPRTLKDDPLELYLTDENKEILDIAKVQEIQECLYKAAVGWTIADLKGINRSLCMHRIVTDLDVKPSIDAQRRLNPNMKEVVKKEVLKWLDTCIIYPISNSKWVSPTQMVPKKAVEKLYGQKFYCFLDGYSGYNQIPIHPDDQTKTTFTCPYGTFSFRRMPFGLCNAPATFHRCMMSIFSDMVRESVEIFMDDFSIFGQSFESYLGQLESVLKRCTKTNLVLSWEKSHFMVHEGILLGHVVSKKGFEVDRTRVQIISTLPPPTNIKAVRSFLGHTGFYRRFIKDFSAISKPLSPILESPDWSKPFKIMCDVSDYAAGAVLGQRVDKKPVVIFSASKTFSEAQMNYTTTEKELLAVVFLLYKFRSYIWGHSKANNLPQCRGAARIWLEKEPPRSIFTWDDLVSKFINQFFPPSKTTNLRNEITNFQQRFDESFSEAWDRFKDLLRACPHHGNFLDRMPRDCLGIIESKSKVRYSRNKPAVTKVTTTASTSGVSPDVAELKDMVRALLLDKKG